MADWIELFEVTVQPGTAPPGQVFPIKFSRPGRIERMEVVIPDGVNGLAGFQLMYAGTVILPLKADKYVIGNDETISWNVYGMFDTGDWAVRAFNNGGYPHTFYFRFLINDVRPSAAPTGLTAGPTGAAVMSLTG